LSGIPYVRDPVMKRELCARPPLSKQRGDWSKESGVVDDLRATLELLSEDAFRPYRICLSNQWNLREV